MSSNKLRFLPGEWANKGKSIYRSLDNTLSGGWVFLNETLLLNIFSSGKNHANRRVSGSETFWVKAL